MIHFLAFVNQKQAKTALLLNLIEPRCGGVLLMGKKGTGKSTLLRAFKEIVSNLSMPFVQLPINATEEAILGGIDIEKTVKNGEIRLERGLLSRANGGFLLIEDINLFPQDILSIVFQVQARKENIIEREGIKLREPSDFQILATLNPEEADFSSHFLDRFGMCVIMDEIKERKEREKIVRLNVEEQLFDLSDFLKRLRYLREFVKEVEVPVEIEEVIVDTVLKEQISGHRADIYLYFASKAYAAYKEEKKVREEHVRAVAPFVLTHRRKYTETHFHEKSEDEEGKEGQNRKVKKEGKAFLSQELNPYYGEFQSRLSGEKEEVFPLEKPYRTKRIALKKDRVVRNATGKRTKTKTNGKAGRYIRAVMRKMPNIAIDATLRAAAPFQIPRGRKDKLIIYEEDLRYKEKERRMSHFVIFVVDGSGSMGVEKRMAATKGAILSLLMDCYQKRDKISMIVFRKDRAEIVLPPTSAIELAVKRLKEIPTGGNTPLGAGLLRAYDLIKKLKFKSPFARFLVFVVTDGKANVSISGKPVFDELRSICLFLKELALTEFVVIDTEKKRGLRRTDLSLKIAKWLNASYFPMEDLKSENILGIVNLYI